MKEEQSLSLDSDVEIKAEEPDDQIILKSDNLPRTKPSFKKQKFSIQSVSQVKKYQNESFAEINHKDTQIYGNTDVHKLMQSPFE